MRRMLITFVLFLVFGSGLGVAGYVLNDRNIVDRALAKMDLIAEAENVIESGMTEVAPRYVDTVLNRFAVFEVPTSSLSCARSCPKDGE